MKRVFADSAALIMASGKFWRRALCGLLVIGGQSNQQRALVYAPTIATRKAKPWCEQQHARRPAMSCLFWLKCCRVIVVGRIHHMSWSKRAALRFDYVIRHLLSVLCNVCHVCICLHCYQLHSKKWNALGKIWIRCSRFKECTKPSLYALNGSVLAGAGLEGDKNRSLPPGVRRVTHARDLLHPLLSVQRVSHHRISE